MFNQFARLWTDKGKNDRDFTAEELKLKQALTEFKSAADQLSRASGALLDLINSRA